MITIREAFERYLFDPSIILYNILGFFFKC